MDEPQLNLHDLNNAHPRTLALIQYRQMRALEKIVELLEKLAKPPIAVPVDASFEDVKLTPGIIHRRRRGADDASTA